MIISIRGGVKKSAIYTIIALIYALILTSLPFDRFTDRDSYLAYAANSLLLLIRNYSHGIANVIINEPIWLVLNIIFSLLLKPESVVKLFIFISSGIFSYIVMHRIGLKNALLIFIILTFPQIIKNYIIHLRQGVAISFFMIAMHTNKRIPLFSFIAGLIHSSFLFVFFFQVLEKLLLRMRFNRNLKALFASIAAILLLLSVISIAFLLSDRRAVQYSESSASVSGLGFLFWLFFSLILYIAGFRLFRQPAGVLSIFIFYLCGYFFLPFIARVFESILPLVLINIPSLKDKYYYTLLLLLIAFSSLQWILTQGAFLL